ncbi:MAG: SGNH/GDSL hydrolase family protein [Desulfobulbaceae bacterium]|nr:SGNH/GDSL hydrolase family protein [Desulfobulbaceae bacterium]
MFRLCLSLIALILIPGAGFCQAGVIIGFGDSLTEGCDVLSGDCGWITGNGYENKLQALLTEHGYNYLVTNYGLGGETTSDALMGRLDSVLNSVLNEEECNQDAEYILILEGTNDLFHYARGLDVKFNLGVMIDKSIAMGLVPLVATIPPDFEPEHSYKNIPLMNTYIRDLVAEKAAEYKAENKEVILVDQYAALYPYWNSFTPGCYGDLIHPNATGFAAMGSVWYATLAELLPRPLTWLHLLLKTP